MAILAIFTCPGLTKEKYESLRKEVKWEHNTPAGAVFHAASFDESGNARVADVWNSVNAMNEFLNSRLMPAMKKFKIAIPKTEVFPLYNANAYKNIEQYKL